MRTNTLIKTSHHTSPSQPPLPSRLPVSREKAEQDATNKRTKQKRAEDGHGNKRDSTGKIRARSL